MSLPKVIANKKMNIFGYLDQLRVFLFYNFENLLFGYLVIYFNDLF